MKPFEFYQPTSVAEAVEALGKHGDGARPIAGGTDLVVQMEEAGREFAALVDGPAGSVGPVAPAEGLTLMAVRYAPGTVMWDDDEDLPTE